MPFSGNSLPKVLHIDDEEDNLYLFRFSFSRFFEVKQTNSLNTLLKMMLEEQFDVVITDYEMPDFNGFDVMKAVKEINPEMPVIFYTGQGNEDIAREAFIQGVSDYFVKDFGGFVHKEKFINSVKRTIENRKSKAEKDAAYKELQESREQFRLIVQNINDAFFIHDFEGNIIDVNENACKMLGYARGELHQLRITDIVESKAAKRYQYQVDRLLQQNNSVFDTLMQQKDSHLIPVEVSAKVISKENDGIIHGFVRDISDRKLTEEALWSSAQVMQAIPSGVFIYTYSERDGLHFYDANKAALGYTKLTMEECKGKGFDELWPQAKKAGITDNYLNVMKTSQPYIGQDVFYGDDKVLGYYRIIAFKISADKLGVAFEDVTEKVKIQEALKESESKVRARLDAVLKPDGDIADLSLSDIINIEAVQSMMDDFHNLTDIGVAILDKEGKVLVATGWQDVCTKFHRVHPVTEENCLESDIILSEGVKAGEYKIYKCKNNMWDMVTPIVVGGRHLGNLFLGQFFFDDEEPDYELFRENARLYGFDEKEYIAAVERAPRWSREKVHRVMDFYSRFTLMISDLSYASLKLARALEEKKRMVEMQGCV